MSRLTDLLQNVSQLDPALGAELTNEYRAMVNSRNYGLVFEKHKPEAVELPSVRPKRGSTVRILPPRGESDMSKADRRLWTVSAVTNPLGGDDTRRYTLVERGVPDEECEVQKDVPCENLIVVSEFQDSIYPGLVETGSVIFADAIEKPAHVVLNAENFHALQLLTFTHRHSIDAIYIDPPYNTGAKDWKYNNDYVGTDDVYRHSKWLSFMERRLHLAKELLNPSDSVLIVTIDEKEYLRLGLLLEQIFPEARIQMVSSVVNPMGSWRDGQFSRVDEYLYFVQMGDSHVSDSTDNMLDEPVDKSGASVRWTPLNRDGSNWQRSDRPGLFYPLFVNTTSLVVEEVGSPIEAHEDKNLIRDRDNCLTVWPMKGTEEARWQVGDETCRELIKNGYLYVSKLDPARKTGTVRYLTSGAQEKIQKGIFLVEGYRSDGSKIVKHASAVMDRPRSVWKKASHSARDHGSALVSKLLPGRKFPFPKSLYAVEDALRFFVKDKPEATVLDFFSGSGTTAHAVMRLNRQDNGRRRSISITNNEVSADEQIKLRKQGLRPGDLDWEKWGICDYITKPRITAAITGNTPEGAAIKGDYKFTDEFPMSEGFPENARFYTLTYLSPNVVTAGRVFQSVAPMLWLTAGQQGRVIDDLGDKGWDVTDYYGVVQDMDNLREFIDAVNATPQCRTVFIVTDDDGAFELAAQAVRDDMKTYRLYESYLSNFEIVNR